jgi:ribosomal protein S30
MLDELAGAFDAFKAVAEQYATAEFQPRTARYAWVRMLEIIERRDAAGERLGEVRRQTERLLALDRWEAFPRVRERLEALAARVGAGAE